jgi:hypothetical protein
MRDPIRATVRRLPWGTWGFREARVKVEFEDRDGMRVMVVMDRARLVDLLSDSALFLDEFGIAELNRRAVRKWTRPFSDSPIPTTDLRYIHHAP